MTTGITRHLPRFLVSLLFALGVLVGGLTAPAQAASATAQAPKTGSQAFSPNWGINPGSQYQCCYTGKGEDVLFIHGVDGSSSGANGSGANGDCKGDNLFGRSLSLLHDSSHQWVGNLKALGYYSGDHDCDGSIRTTPHASNCNGYFDTPASAIGTNNEDDRHLACLLAWYIWDNYTVNTWTVNVVAHSLGGVLIKYALYRTGVTFSGSQKSYDSHFPSYLFIDHIVTIASPLNGVPKGGASQDCNCKEVEELEALGGEINGELTGDARNASGLDGTFWTMIGESSADGNTGCDHVGNSAFGMNYGFKYDYSSPVSGIKGMQDACQPPGSSSYYYGHGTYLQDNQTANDVTIKWCTDCTGNPTNSASNFHHALTTMFWSLTGNCEASPDVYNCDGDDSGVTGCSSTGHLQSGDVSYLKIYWSTDCSTNWAVVSAPSGYLKTVTIARSPTRSWNDVDRHFIYCVQNTSSCPADTWWTFGPTTTSWRTDMLYAPNEGVAVRITTTTGATYTSIWH